MARTELRSRGVSPKRVPDQWFKFACLYVKDGGKNGRQAAIDAGFSEKTAAVRAVKILKDPRMKAIVGKMLKEQRDKFAIEADEILWHLWACATRNGKDFVDKKGVLLITSQNINDLSDEVTAAIDSIKQKRRVYTTEDGETIEEIETEVRLVSKAAALDMAMKHKGLFAPQEVHGKLTFDFDKLYQDQRDTIDVDPIEQKLLEEERSK